jgi:sRNA-binding regulator protein Hfq
MEEHAQRYIKFKMENLLTSSSLLMKYKRLDKEITVTLTDGSKFTGKIRWADDYSVKIILPDGSITIPIHNILYMDTIYVPPSLHEFTYRVYHGRPLNTGREIQQLNKYMKSRELLHFYLENGVEIRGRLDSFESYIYFIKPVDGDRDYQIMKRHILYYKKIDKVKTVTINT